MGDTILEAQLQTAAEMQREHDRDIMKDLLRTMFNGWLIHTRSWNNRKQAYRLSDDEAMIKACGGDQHKGQLLLIFSHWSNDIQSIAAYYGIGFSADGKQIIDIPPPPTDEHWWDKGEWHPPFQEEKQAEGPGCGTCAKPGT